jgi:adenylate cyclase
MNYHEFYYKWEWNLPASPEKLWPLVSDTNRFNQLTGLERLELNESTPNGRRLRIRRFGLVPIEWEESPFEWVYGRRFGVIRRYTQGPVAEMRVLAHLEPVGDHASHLTYEVWARPKNPLGLLAIPVQIGILSARDFDRAFRLFGRLAQTAEPIALLPAQVTLVPGALGRIATARANLLAQRVNETWLDKLIWLIEQGNELTVSQLRPYQLADLWGAPRREILELCLLATRAGLLDFQWELLCPYCRGSGTNVHKHMEEIHQEVHCHSCQVDFSANFAQSVEITFQPAAAIRTVERLEFCVAGPQVTPHVVVQQVLLPGETRTLQVGLERGAYRVVAENMENVQAIIAAEAGPAEVWLSAPGGVWPDDEKMMGLTPTLHWHNPTTEPLFMALERVAWRDDVVTAAEVTTLQRFRDLFASEACAQMSSLPWGVWRFCLRIWWVRPVCIMRLGMRQRLVWCGAILMCCGRRLMRRRGRL